MTANEAASWRIERGEIRIPVSTVPEGESGEWVVRRFTVEENEGGRLRALVNPNAMGRWTPPGTYTGLSYRGTIIMSDTSDECYDLLPIVLRQNIAHVLVGGLGLGVVLGALLEREGVKEIVVVEIEQDVINLVGPHYRALAASRGVRLEIIHADLFEWSPKRGTRYDAVWFDIWPNICSDHVAGMQKLLRRFRARSPWVRAWCQEEMQGISRRGGGWS